jgi:hypothetical protein
MPIRPDEAWSADDGESGAREVEMPAEVEGVSETDDVLDELESRCR